jgi:DNA-binding XRE family transcriptional regulator
MTKLLEILAQNIKEKRNKLGYSQQKLAELANITTSFLGMIEVGKKVPSLETAEKIAGALGMTVSQLFSDENGKSDCEEKQELLIKMLKELKNKVGDDIDKIVQKYIKK